MKFTILFFIIIAVLLSGCSQSSPNSIQLTPNSVIVFADKNIDTLGATIENSTGVAAKILFENEYKGKYVIWEGYVDRIEADYSAQLWSHNVPKTMYIQLKTNQDEVLQNIQKGQKIRFQARVIGYEKDSQTYFARIIMDDGSIIEIIQ